MKENSHRFMLAYSSPLLEPNAVNNMGCSGEEQLSRNALLIKYNIESFDERLKYLMKRFHISTHAK